jgi:hypothetical protein
MSDCDRTAPSDKVGGVYREEGDVERTHAPQHAHSTSRSTVASDGEELCKAAEESARAGGVIRGVGVLYW